MRAKPFITTFLLLMLLFVSSTHYDVLLKRFPCHLHCTWLQFSHTHILTKCQFSRNLWFAEKHLRQQHIVGHEPCTSTNHCALHAYIYKWCRPFISLTVEPFDKFVIKGKSKEISKSSVPLFGLEYFMHFRLGFRGGFGHFNLIKYRHLAYQCSTANGTANLFILHTHTHTNTCEILTDFNIFAHIYSAHTYDLIHNEKEEMWPVWHLRHAFVYLFFLQNFCQFDNVFVSV